jgi:phenylalanyl-tRNA synthetase beta chain
MRVPLQWLREYVRVDVPVDELAARVNSAVAGVERVIHRGVADVDGNLGLFRVGRVVEAGKHPNADRLQLCRVDVGEGEPRQIVCGAWNFGAGATVAVALPGALLPGVDEPLREATLRGEVSRGMILSERELELGTDHTGILVLEDEHEPGTPLVDILPVADVVLELETTPNRPDLLAVYGVARDIAALYGLELAPMPGVDSQPDGDEPVDVTIDDLEGCPRYIGRLFRDVSVRPSPPWLKARLVGAGLRPISNVVDITNYVMHGLGNPLHAFDLHRLHGERVVVRRARRDEEIRTLDGTTRRLDERDLLIADADRPVAIAGIMGGEDSEVTAETTDVLLEAANFEPVSILKSSERLALRTDGSNRWEKGVDPHLAEPAALLATELLVGVAGARWTGHVDVQGELPSRPVIRLRPERVNALVGLEITPDEQRDRLTQLGFDVSPDWTVTTPTWRARDVTREVDLVEEVARFRLDDVPFTLPRRETIGRLTDEQRLRRTVEDVLVGAGYTEIQTTSLVARDAAPGGIALPEPLTADHAALRHTLKQGLVATAARHLELGIERVALYEIGRVYLPSRERFAEERVHVGLIDQRGIARAKGAVELVLDALHLDSAFERTDELPFVPGRGARVVAAGHELGRVGELRPTELHGGWGYAELVLDVLALLQPPPRQYDDVITFPPVKQDMAFVVDEHVEAAELEAAAREAAGPELRSERGRSRSRSRSSSSRPSGRFPTMTRRRCASESCGRSTIVLARICARKRSAKPLHPYPKRFFVRFQRAGSLYGTAVRVTPRGDEENACHPAARRGVRRVDGCAHRVDGISACGAAGDAARARDGARPSEQGGRGCDAGTRCERTGRDRGRRTRIIEGPGEESRQGECKQLPRQSRHPLDERGREAEQRYEEAHQLHDGRLGVIAYLHGDERHRCDGRARGGQRPLEALREREHRSANRRQSRWRRR